MATATQVTQVTQADGIVAQYKPANGGTATARIVRKSGAYVVQAPGHLIQGIETEQAARDELAAMGFVPDPSVQIMGGRVIAGVPQYKRDQTESDRRVAHKREQEKIAQHAAERDAMRDAVVSVVRTFSAALAPVAAQDRKRAEKAASKTAGKTAKPSKAATRIAAENATAKARADAKQDKPATGKTAAAPASAPKTASKAPAGKPAKQDKAPREKAAKPAKQDKPATVYTDAAPVVHAAVTYAAVYTALGGKQYHVDAALAAKQGKIARTGGNDSLLHWAMAQTIAAHNGGNGAMPEAAYLAARALDRALDGQDGATVTPAVRAYLCRYRAEHMPELIAEMGARGVATPQQAAAYVNGWHLLQGTARGVAEVIYRRMYHWQDRGVAQSYTAWLHNTPAKDRG